MSSTSEVGHAKNVANFEHLISFCTGFGPGYNPSNAAISIASLNTLLTDAKNALTEVTTKIVAYNNTVNHRIQTFSDLKKLSTRLVNALIATGASDETIANAKSVNKKIQGQRATPPTHSTPDPNNPQPAPATISASQQSYDQITEHFSKLVEILHTETNYTPNEIELNVATQTTLLQNMHTANTQVGDAYTAISIARIERNHTLYDDKTGLCPIALEVKNYIKSVAGASSPEYKQISKIKFVTRK